MHTSAAVTLAKQAHAYLLIASHKRKYGKMWNTEVKKSMCYDKQTHQMREYHFQIHVKHIIYFDCGITYIHKYGCILEWLPTEDSSVFQISALSVLSRNWSYLPNMSEIGGWQGKSCNIHPLVSIFSSSIYYSENEENLPDSNLISIMDSPVSGNPSLLV